MKHNKQATDKTTAQSAPALELHQDRSKVHCGQDCKFYITGSEFDHVEDAELIASLVPSAMQWDE
jgi:hypothetical protein